MTAGISAEFPGICGDLVNRNNVLESLFILRLAVSKIQDILHFSFV